MENRIKAKPKTIKSQVKRSALRVLMNVRVAKHKSLTQCINRKTDTPFDSIWSYKTNWFCFRSRLMWFDLVFFDFLVAISASYLLDLNIK